MQADGKTPFLGIAVWKHSCPMTLTLRVRPQQGGTGKVRWKSAQQESFPADERLAQFKIPAGHEWQDVSVSIPIEGQVGIVRIHLPAASSAVLIESLTFTDVETKQPIRAWNFGASKK
jgi:hypothetical protein